MHDEISIGIENKVFSRSMLQVKVKEETLLILQGSFSFSKPYRIWKSYHKTARSKCPCYRYNLFGIPTSINLALAMTLDLYM